MPSKGPSRSKTEEAKVPLQAVVLADSFTHRFRPITLERPKTLLPLANVPMIEYTLEFLASNGVEEVFVFCCAHADQLTQYIENSAWSNTAGFVVHTIVSTNCISAGEALRLIDHKHVIRSDFILISGDTVANMDLRRALEVHRERRKTERLAIMTCCFKTISRRQREEHLGESNLVVAMDPGTGRVLHYDEQASPSLPDAEKGSQKKAKAKLAPLSLDASLFSEHPSVRVRTDLQDCHVDVCAPEVLMLFTDNFDYQHLRRDFVCGTLNERELGNNIYAHELGAREYATRVTNLRTYDAVSRDVINRWVYPVCPDVNCLPRGDATLYKHTWPQIYLEKGCEVDPSAVIGGGCVIGDGCVIGPGAVIERSTLGRGAVVGANARLTGSYVMTNARIAPIAVVTSALIYEGAVIHESARVGKGAIISYDVVVGSGHSVPDYSRISLAPQPAHDDEADSDDELEIGSFGGAVARNSDSSRGNFMARSESKGSVGGGFGSDDETDAGVRGVFLTDHERVLLQRAKDGTAGGASTELWAPEGVGVGGAGHAWAPRWGEEEWRFSIAPAPPGSSDAAYARDDALDSDDDAAHVRSGAKAAAGGGDGSDSETGSDAEDGAFEAHFRKEVAETFLRCVKHGYEQANAVVELQGLKMAENRTFADIARYVLMTILGLSLPAPKDVTKENSRLYPASAPENTPSLLKSIRERLKQWAPLLSRFLKSEDDQVEMLLTLEDYCAEDEVFKGMHGASLVPSFAKILHLLYDMDVLSEVSVLAWAEEKGLASEEDKRFLKLAQPFVDWLKEADSESDGEGSDSSEASSSEEEEE